MRCAGQLLGISTVSMRYTVALRVWTLPHTTRASLAVYVSPDFAVRMVLPCSVVRVPESRLVGPWRCWTTWYVRMLVNACLSARTLVRVSAGILANASLVGANTVRAGALLSVSTRPALVTAATSVDSAGFCEAAVATGSLAMTARLPGPLAGTPAQAGPNGPPAAACPTAAGLEVAGAGVAGA